MPEQSSPLPANARPEHNPLRTPGLGLLLLSSLTFVFLLVMLPLNVTEVEQMLIDGIALSDPETAGKVAAIIVLFFGSLLIMIGSISMLSLRFYNLAFLGALVSILPMLFPCLMLCIPFGIWAVFLMVNPEVRGRFR